MDGLTWQLDTGWKPFGESIVLDAQLFRKVAVGASATREGASGIWRAVPLRYNARDTTDTPCRRPIINPASPTLELPQLALIALAALLAGGMLISFPALTAAGISNVAASVTNTVALSPGYLSATFAQWNDLKTQRKRLLWLAPAAILGGITGGYLLLNTGEKLFKQLVPFLILMASLLLALQGPLRKWLTARQGKGGAHNDAWVALPIFLASIYGGYFGAGLSVIVLAVLGLVIDDSLTRLNALKQAVAFCVNVAAALFFLGSGQVVWLAAAVMAVGAIVGGALGGRLAGRIKPNVLRTLVVVIGVIVSLIYFIRG